MLLHRLLSPFREKVEDLLPNIAPGFGSRAGSVEDKLNTSTDEVPPGREIADALGSAIDRLEQAIHNRVGPRIFYSRADDLKEIAYQAFRSGYDLDLYAKALTLKLTNLAVAKYNYELRHTKLVAAPIQLMIDPANSCPLACPACVHTKNSDLKFRFDWPGGLLPMAVFDRFIEMYGPYSSGVVFFNYGEPFLNKKTPQMIARAKANLLHTSVSSNLNVPMDAEAVVRSGLDALIASIDGATQSTYARYRRGGQIETCFQNIRNLVEVRRRLGSATPWIEWQFLTFEHNEHEVDLALEIAGSLGVDEVKVATPFAVDHDDPEIHIIKSPMKGRHVLNRPPQSPWPPSFSDRISDKIEESFASSWTNRALELGVLDEAPASTSATCTWLYQSVTIDALGRIMPCCMPPEKDLNRTYGVFPNEEADPANATMMMQSRASFADRRSFDAAVAGGEIKTPPYCSICHENPEPTYNVRRDSRRDLRLIDHKQVVSDSDIERLTNWSDGGRGSITDI